MKGASCESYSMMAVSAFSFRGNGIYRGCVQRSPHNHREIAALKYYRIEEQRAYLSAQHHTVLYIKFPFHGEDDTDMTRLIIFKRLFGHVFALRGCPNCDTAVLMLPSWSPRQSVLVSRSNPENSSRHRK